MWVLFDWLTGSVVREFETSDDKIILDAGGEDSAEISIPLPSLPLSVRKNWRNTFTGIKRGVLYYENTASGAEVLYAGQITKSSLDEEEIKVSASSMLTYLANYTYVPVGTTSITDAKATQTFSKVTAKSYITSLLEPVNADAFAPNISIGANSGPSRTLSTEIRLRDLSSVGELLLGQLEDPAGSEFRFMPSLNSEKTQVSWSIDFPSSGRLLRGTGETVGVNLSNPEVKLVSLSPSEDFSDFFNSLWHEIDVEEGVSIQRSDNIPSGFPRFNDYINFASALTPEERTEQVTARLEDSSKGLQNWEVQIFNEQVNSQNEILLPGARYGEGYLGKQVNIQGGEEFDAESLNGVYRCLGVQFSSHDSLVSMQLADSREIYPRVPKRIIDRIGKDLVKSPAFKIPPSEKVGGGWEAPEPGDGGGGGIDPWDSSVPGWDWGSENTPFPEMPAPADPVYGFEFGEYKNVNPFILGDNFPDLSEKSSMRVVWEQGNNGNDVYCAWIENYSGFPASTTVLNNGLGFTLNLERVDNPTRYRVPDLASSEYPKIVFSSGLLKEGNIERFERRGELVLTKKMLENLIFTGRRFDDLTKQDRTLSVNRVDFNIHSLSSSDGSLMVFISVRPYNSTWSGRLHVKTLRILTIRKSRWDSLDSDLTGLSASVITEKSTLITTNFRGINRAQTQTLLNVTLQDRIIYDFEEGVDPYYPFDTMDKWIMPVADLNQGAFAVGKGELNYPYTEFEGGEYSFWISRTGLRRSFHQLPGGADEKNTVCVSNSSMGMRAITSAFGSSATAVDIEKRLGNNGFLSGNTFTPWNVISKTKNGQPSHYHMVQNRGTGSAPNMSRISYLTIEGSPVAIGFIFYGGSAPSNFTRAAFLCDYMGRAFVTNPDFPEDDFNAIEDGFDQFDSMPGRPVYYTQSTDPRYGQYQYGRSKLPGLSYTAKEIEGFDVNTDNLLFVPPGSQSLSRPAIFYNDGYIYYLPTSYGQDVSRDPTQPPPAISVEITKIEEPNNSFWGGDIPINGSSSLFGGLPSMPGIGGGENTS